MPFNETQAINAIATQEASIPGVTQSFGYAQNPDSLNNVLPAVIHFIPSFTSTRRGFHNLWANSLVFNSVVFVIPRDAGGGKLRYIEKAAIPFGQKDSPYTNKTANVQFGTIEIPQGMATDIKQKIDRYVRITMQVSP